MVSQGTISSRCSWLSTYQSLAQCPVEPSLPEPRSVQRKHPAGAKLLGTLQALCREGRNVPSISGLLCSDQWAQFLGSAPQGGLPLQPQALSVWRSAQCRIRVNPWIPTFLHPIMLGLVYRRWPSQLIKVAPVRLKLQPIWRTALPG